MTVSLKLLRYKFGHFLSVNLGEVRPTSTFSEMFRQQLDMLEKIEEDSEKGLDSSVHDQVCNGLVMVVDRSDMCLNLFFAAGAVANSKRELGF